MSAVKIQDTAGRVIQTNMEDDPIPSAYAGRWVARLHGHIIAQGGTPELALRAAQCSRHKESPEVIYVPAELNFHPLVDRVRAALPGQELYLVGGAVRDVFLGRLSPDLDFAVPSNGTVLARRVADALGADYMTLDGERDTGRVIVTEGASRLYLDFATYRLGNFPAAGQGLETDLRSRDFTINAMAFDLRLNVLLDPLDGAADLRAKRIRQCSPGAFLRGVRLAASLGFQIEKATRQAMKEAAPLLGRASPERQRDELFKILDSPKVDASIRALELLGVLPHLLPELVALNGVEQSLPHIHDVWNHTLAVLGSLEEILAALAVEYDPGTTNDLYTGLLGLRIGRYREQFSTHFQTSLNATRSLRSLLFFTALYHDVSKPQTRTVEQGGRVRFFGHDQQGADLSAHRLAELRLSNDEIERVRTIIDNHMRFHFFTSRLEGESRLPSRKSIYRFFRASGIAGVDLVLLGLADLRGTQGNNLKQETWTAALDVARLLLENYWEKPEETIAPPRLVDGHDLMKEFGIEPGPDLGKVLEAIREAQATGKVTSRVDALEYARSWIRGSQL
jgi:tRNA nucleotidyltransferase/poly(A) polymerase